MNLNRLFIVGVGRSGTSMIQAILDTHSKISFFPETHYLRAIINNNNESQLTIPEIMLLYPKLNRIDFLKENSDENQTFTRLKFFDFISQKKIEASRAEFIGDKDPRLVEKISSLLSKFPQAKIICISRDPGDVLVSKSNAQWSKNRNWALNTFISYSQIICQEEFTKQFPKNCLVIKYEDLTDKAEICLKNICNFLDIEYEDSINDFEESAKRLISKDEEQWKSNTLKPMFKNSTKWKSSLSFFQIQVLYMLYKDIRGMHNYCSLYKNWLNDNQKKVTLPAKILSKIIIFFGKKRAFLLVNNKI